MRGSYRGYDIVSMPPPSSGGVELIEMLNILEGYDLAHDDETQTLFLMIEAMKRAYADRALFLGDPDNGQGSGGAADFEKLCRDAARHASIPTHATPASAIRAGGTVDARRPQHHAFLDRRPFRQCGVEHLHAQFQLWRGPGGGGHRHSSQQRARRFRRQAGRAERLWPDRLRGQRAGARASGRCRR